MRKNKTRDISIHTALADSDKYGKSIKNVEYISIHTALAGSDIQVIIDCIIKKISIHIAFAGSDAEDAEMICQIIDFNPHCPCGQ